MIQLLAILALYFFAAEAFTPKARRAKRQRSGSIHIDRLLLPLVTLYLLMWFNISLNWVTHVVALLLLGFFGKYALQVGWALHKPRLLIALVASLMLWQSPASWVIYPLLIMGIIWVMVYSRYSKPPAMPLEGEPVVAPAETWDDPELLQELPPARVAARFGATPEPESLGVPVAPASAPPQFNAQPTQPTQPMRAEPNELSEWLLDPRLPLWIRDKVRALDEETATALYYFDANDKPIGERPLHETLYLVRAIRHDYAPGALRAYVRLPRPQAHTVAVEGNKTAADLLGEQLDMMLESVKGHVLSSLHTETDQLKSHGRFLRDKLQQGKGELDLD